MSQIHNFADLEKLITYVINTLRSNHSRDSDDIDFYVKINSDIKSILNTFCDLRRKYGYHPDGIEIIKELQEIKLDYYNRPLQISAQLEIVEQKIKEINGSFKLNAERKLIVLIGNGFDVSLGLKTRYEDFWNWLLKNKQDFRNSYYRNTFIQHLGKGQKNWYDIESAYYQQLCEYVRKKVKSDEAQLDPSIKRGLLTTYHDNDYNQDVASNNKCLEKISDFLREYLKQEYENKKQSFNSDSTIIQKYKEIFSGYQIINCEKNIDNTYFINFNYTNTLVDLLGINQDQVFHIHGHLNDENQGIIFGYGDETDAMYSTMQNLGDNKLLEHIKSNNYLFSSCYKKILALIESSPFDLIICGLSCGLSDRVFLETIFKHKNCEKIDLMYHKKADDTDNFKDILINVSRHFENPAKMRDKILPQNPQFITPQLEESEVTNKAEMSLK